jgi:hypothetical protein
MASEGKRARSAVAGLPTPLVKHDFLNRRDVFDTMAAMSAYSTPEFDSPKPSAGIGFTLVLNNCSSARRNRADVFDKARAAGHKSSETNSAWLIGLIDTAVSPDLSRHCP